jgi:hypothetical protein
VATIVGVITVAALHAAVYLSLWSASFAKFEAVPRKPEPPVMIIVGYILGFPLMFLPARWIVSLAPLVGPTNVVFLLAGINAILWACVIVFTWRKLQCVNKGRGMRA